MKKLWVTVHENDDEAFEIWTKHIDPSRIIRFGDKDNFWAMGDTGAWDLVVKFSMTKAKNISTLVKTKWVEMVIDFRNLEFSIYAI